MATRRNFIKATGLASSAISFGIPSFGAHSDLPFISKRPALAKRRFVSAAVENTIMEAKKIMADEELAWMFENCFPNTLDTTVSYEEKEGKPYTYVITGDIDAMWLRDSSAQVWPYLPLAKDDKPLQQLIKGVVNRQVKCILKETYDK